MIGSVSDISRPSLYTQIQLFAFPYIFFWSAVVCLTRKQASAQKNYVHIILALCLARDIVVMRYKWYCCRDVNALPLRESLTEKPLPHLSQMKFLLLSWRRFLCFFNSTGRPNDLLQMLHLKSFLPSWTVCTWRIKLERIVNVFKHNWHWINFGNSPEPLGLPFFGFVENWIFLATKVVSFLDLYNKHRSQSDIIAPESFRHRVRTALPDFFVDVWQFFSRKCQKSPFFDAKCTNW